jgi:hypothetical protein
MAAENRTPRPASSFADGQALAARLLQHLSAEDSREGHALVLSYLDAARRSRRRSVKDGFASALCDYLYSAVDRAIATTDRTIGTTQRADRDATAFDPVSRELAAFIEAAVIVAGPSPLEGVR